MQLRTPIHVDPTQMTGRGSQTPALSNPIDLRGYIAPATSTETDQAHRTLIDNVANAHVFGVHTIPAGSVITADGVEWNVVGDALTYRSRAASRAFTIARLERRRG